MKTNRSSIIITCIIFSFAILVIATGISNAQIPSTDIFIIDLKLNKDGKYTFSEPVNITNRPGYDNQPAFSSTGKIYYTARIDSNGTDIYVYDFLTGKTQQVTKTKESEYSPTIEPGNKGLSVVRVDLDSAQRLYLLNPEGRNPRLLVNGEDSVGYHCWINDQKLALFILGDTSTLMVVDIKSQKKVTVASNIGRCIAKIPGSNQVSFVEKVSATEWFIKSWDLETKKTAFLMKMPEGTEDYAWTPEKKLLVGKEGRLYLSDPFKGLNWMEIGNFFKTIGSFYRIAINPTGTKIAVVNYQGTKP